ncbi:MAG: hypothetical protein ACM3SU_04785, partial [Acidobacteriota bacterium]
MSRRRAGAALLALAAVLAEAGAVPAKPPRRLAGEPPEKVRAEFETICRGFRAGRNPYYGLAQIEELERQLAAPEGDSMRRVTLRGALAQEL